LRDTFQQRLTSFISVTSRQFREPFISIRQMGMYQYPA
jgi:hypothetical protein